MFIAEPKRKSYLESIELEIEEIIASGQNSNARELSASTRQEFEFYNYPQYFQGNLQAKVVFVNLNCQEKSRKESEKFSNFKEYLEACQQGEKRKETIKKGSSYELKRLQFLEPFAKKEERDRLHLFLIPYTAKKLSLVNFTPKIFQPLVEKTLDIIVEHPRDYIIFNGSVFEQILRPYIAGKQHLVIGKERGKKLQFSLLDLVYKQQTIKVGLAHSYNSLSMSAIEYGQHCKQLYDAA